jgi:hypothetical protein
MKRIALFILVVSICGFVFSQKIVPIKNVKGEYILPPKSDLSMKIAYEKACNEAKLEALRKAGVAENITSSDVLTSNQKGENFKQELNSILSVELNGAVLNDSIVSESSVIDPAGNTKIQVYLNVEVIKYESVPDPSFDFKVEGLKEYYENENLMRFTFNPYSNGYLKIFNINDAENYVIYPYQDKDNAVLNDSLNHLFRANKSEVFPVNKNLGNNKEGEGYTLSTNLNREKNFLIFVYTKENIPFMLNPTYKNIISWIYRITPERRRVRFYDFVIVNKDAK